MYSDNQLDALEAIRLCNPDKAIQYFAADLQERGNNAFSLRGMAHCLATKNEYEQAERSIRFCSQLFPNDPDTWMIYGNIISQLGDNTKAIEYTERSLELMPQQFGAMWNLSMFLMKSSFWEDGWNLYETGLIGGQRKRRCIQAPLEPGQEPRGTVFIWGEQGAGDTFMFFRYVKLFRERYPNVKILLEVGYDQLPLFTDCSYVDQVYARPTSLGLPYTFDCNIALMSLPRFLGLYDPQPMSRYIEQDAGIVEWAGSAIPFAKDKPNVGLVWKGSKMHTNDINRSMPWETIKQLICPEAQFFTLQDNEKIEDDGSFINLNGDMLSWSTTYATLEHLDIVIAVDTAIAHLFAQMGKKTLILHPKCVEWRWSGNWYHDVTHIKQTVRRDWTSVIEEAKAWLKTTLPGLSRQTLTHN